MPGILILIAILIIMVAFFRIVTGIRRSDRHRGYGSGLSGFDSGPSNSDNGFFTGLFLGSMFSNHHSPDCNDISHQTHDHHHHGHSDATSYQSSDCSPPSTDFGGGSTDCGCGGSFDSSGSSGGDCGSSTGGC